MFHSVVSAKLCADSPTVVRALIDSAHTVSMLTGDAPLTAEQLEQLVSKHQAALDTLTHQAKTLEAAERRASEAEAVSILLEEKIPSKKYKFMVSE